VSRICACSSFCRSAVLAVEEERQLGDRPIEAGIRARVDLRVEASDAPERIAASHEHEDQPEHDRAVLAATDGVDQALVACVDQARTSSA
jgi:hypothetical protein